MDLLDIYMALTMIGVAAVLLVWVFLAIEWRRLRREPPGGVTPGATTRRPAA